jgi:hypothetical protein
VISRSRIFAKVQGAAGVFAAGTGITRKPILAVNSIFVMGYQMKPIGESSVAWEETMKIMDRYHMLVKVFVAVTASALLMSATASPVAAQIVRWRTVVAIVQPGNIVGSFTTPPSCPINGAGCFNGGGLPWSGGGLPPHEEQQQLSNNNQGQGQRDSREAQVTVNLATGQLQFQVHALVLAGGNSIGTVPSTITSVVGTVICIVAPSGPNVIFNTVPVALSSSGDAQFSGPVGAIPTSCTSSNIAFLVRNSVTGNWIANGSVRTSSP